MTARAAASDLVPRLLVQHGGSTGRPARAEPVALPRAPDAAARRPARATGRPSRRGPHRAARRAVGLAAASTLVAAGLVNLPALPAAADSPALPAAADVASLPPEAEVLLVSRSDQGWSGSPSVTPDGQKVVYVSTAGDLADGTQPDTPNVFLATATQGSADPFSGAPQLVSRPDADLPDAPANDMSYDPVASADGRHIAFVSHATNLVPDGATPGRASVYVHDLLTGATYRLDAGTEPNGDTSDPDISDDGEYVVFASAATNLSPGDTNDAADVFVADLDANDDGTRGDVAITRLLAEHTVPGGTSQPAISGDGEWIVFTTSSDDPAGEAAAGEVPHVFRVHRDGRAGPRLVFEGAHDGAVDAVGNAFAAIVDECEGAPVVAGATLDANGAPYAVGVGWAVTDRRVGQLWEPFISSDGSTIGWSTTQPRRDLGLGGALPDPLAEPVVRVANPSWSDASRLEVPCAGFPDEVTEIGVGRAAGMSASGRTVVLGGPSVLAGAEQSVTAVDRHTHDGLSVSHTTGELTIPGYVTSVPISDIPVSAVTDYGAALAAAPLSRLPVARLPIWGVPLHRLPVHRLLIGDAPLHRVGTDEVPISRLPISHLAIHRLPVHRPDIPGGWTELLAETEFAGDLEQTVTLADVLAWAGDALAGSVATPAERDAATRIRSLSLSDVALDGSGIDSLSIAAILLGGAPLSQVPIAGTGTPLERWQAIVAAQVLGLDVDDAMVLAELDAAGLAVEQTGIESVPVNRLPVDATLLDEVPMAATGGRPGLFLEGTPLGGLDVGDLSPTAQVALFGGSREGTLAENAHALLDTATVADLARGAPDTITLGTVLFSVLDRTSYPWEQIDPAVIPVDAGTETTAGGSCDGGDRCSTVAQFQFAFDPGPGEPTAFAAPTASVVLPGSSRLDRVRSGGSGPAFADASGGAYDGPVQTDGSLVRFPLADTAAGTVRMLRLHYTHSHGPGAWNARAVLASGELTAHDEILGSATHDDDVSEHNRHPDGTWQGTPKTLIEGEVNYEWISPAGMGLDDDGARQAPAEDEDWYLVRPPAPGERLVISSNASDGKIALSLLEPEHEQTPLGLPRSGNAPGTAVTEQESRDASSPAESGADAGAAAPGLALVDQAVVGGDGTASVESSSAARTAEEDWFVRVTSGTGLAGPEPYSLRATYVPEAPAQRCTPWTPPAGVEVEDPLEPWPEIESDAVTDATNTVYLMDTARFRAVHGLEATEDVVASIRALDGVGAVVAGGVVGAILSIDTDPAVVAARFALDADPCSMTARRDLAAAVIAFAREAIGGENDHVTSIVIIGGDDMIPFAPVPQRTRQFTEASHAGQLRLTAQPDGRPCPTGLGADDIDPCATPLSAAAAASVILTDDPYGLAEAYESPSGDLYVPTVAVGRLVDSPDQIRGQLDRFRLAGGILEGDSALSGGYGAWAELPQLVSENLAWRLGGGDAPLPEPWTKEDAESALFPADGSDAPRFVSLSGHADERRLLAGVEGAARGEASESDLLRAEDHVPPLVPSADQSFDPLAPTSPLDGSLVFLIGSHSGNNLPAAYYGDVTDWADVFGPAGGFIGNTGFGLTDDVTTAFSERLLDLYADWIGVQTEAGAVTSGGALLYAKQAYLGGVGLYTGHDEKVLMQSVYYGVPMYSFADSTKEQPLPPAPDLSVVDAGGGLSSAALDLTPSFATVTRTDETGAEVTYVSADDELPVAAAGQPLLPRVTTRIPSGDEAGNVPRGALITSLASKWSGTVRPAVADPGIGSEQGGTTKDELAFPSRFTSISRQVTPDGPIALVVATPGSVQSAYGGLGRIETFPIMGLEVLYGPEGDSVPPMVHSTAQREGFSVRASDSADDGSAGVISRAVLLVQNAGIPDDGSTHPWTTVELTADASGTWQAELPASLTGPYRWILQVVDGAGNVTTDSARGRIAVADAPAPVLGDPGPAITAVAGERVVRSIPVTAAAGATVTGVYRLLDEGGSERTAGTLTVSPTADGALRAVLDAVLATPGAFTVELEVCSGATTCESATFDLTVTAANAAPRAGVSLDDGGVTPSSSLSADATSADLDDDRVELSFRWLRNGVPIEGADAATLDLAGIARENDVIRVEVTPHDGSTAGHAASADVVVGADKPLPTIAVWATSAGETYVEGTWATADVVVSFTCTGVGVECPAPETVSADTAGREIVRTVADTYGRTASAGITVRVDKRAPAPGPGRFG